MISLWTHETEAMRQALEGQFPPLEGDVHTDVLVIGGGMAGILLAHALRERGVDIRVVEAKTIGSGATKNTTAKITAQHGLIYASLAKGNHVEKARRYYEANMAAVARYRTLAETYPCDFEEKTAYVYSVDQRKKLEDEMRAYEQMGIKAIFCDNPPLPIATVGALGMEGQAQFQPLKLLYGLAKGLPIHEGTMVESIEGHMAITKNGRIHAKHIVLATHYPLVNIPGLYFMKLYQSRSYVLALDGATDVNGLYIDEREDGHSFRNHQGLLLVGGGDHRTGKTGGGWEELRGLASSAYPQATEKFAWAAQDCMSLDAMPYIGRHRASTAQMYVATGFSKWGMTGAMVSATLLCDLITTGKAEYEDLFAPNRSLLHLSLFGHGLESFMGMVKLGQPRCPHMGCALTWNKREHTWDCPCHGSRFDQEGHVLDNPAKKGLPHA